MAEIYVRSSNSLQEVITQLRDLNTQFRTQAENIRTEQGNLTQKWEGDASTAFQEHFRAEEGNFESFATTIDEYVRGLEEILRNYEVAEQMNKNIAES